MFYKPYGSGGSIPPFAPPTNVTRIEYYVDTDPGFGGATTLNITPGTNIQDAVIAIDPSTLGPGNHKLFVRAKNANNNWSLTNSFDFTAALVAQKKPGSGNAISLDGVNDYVSIPHNAALKPSAQITIEAWVYPRDIHSNRYYEIYRKEDGNDRHLFSFQENGTILSFGLGIAGSYAELDVPISASNYENQWVHVAAVYDGFSKKIYRNGVMIGSTSVSGSIGTSGTSPGIIGSWGGSQEFFNGVIDEVRIWTTVLTQTQIRDRMCRKINSSDALYPNLVAYYNFDESAGTDVVDGANGNNGMLVNSPLRITSGAAIGDSSRNTYVTTGLPAANISTNGQDNLTVNYSSGTFTGEAGTHVYVVSEKPNTQNGIAVAGTNDRYFGVFSANINNPAYTATYNYNGNPFINTLAETDLSLFKRVNNSDTAWENTNAILNATANTLTATGQNTEYILGAVPCLLAAPTASATSQPSCTVATGTITIAAPTAGITYSIGSEYQAGAVFNNITPGTYNVTAKNAGGCISSATSVIINQAPLIPAMPTANTVQPTCTVATGTITITAPVAAGLNYGINGVYQTGTAFNNLSQPHIT